MLIDEITIICKGGKGGDGSNAMRREKYIPRGGPSGGDGGRGGNVYFISVTDLSVLGNLKKGKLYKAEDGRGGSKGNKTGRKGRDFEISVPCGTVVHDIKSGRLIKDFLHPGERMLITQGGTGGRGNIHFKTAQNRTPFEFERGREGEKKNLKLEMRFIADFGLLGFPNAGKTSLLNALTGAGAKTASYPFTTLYPNLGTLDRVIIADVPGLIERASEGKGLGIKFLKHIRRAKALVHLISVENEEPLKSYLSVRKEIMIFDGEMDNKEEVILLTKTDLASENEIIKKLKILQKTGKPVFTMSIKNKELTDNFKKYLLSGRKNAGNSKVS